LRTPISLAPLKKQELAMPFEGYHAEAACNLSGIA
jgi:hypothetical protein